MIDASKTVETCSIKQDGPGRVKQRASWFALLDGRSEFFNLVKVTHSPSLTRYVIHAEAAQWDR
jgi:hypothetical protein